MTICQSASGDSHVKWNVPARTSAPSTASPMTSAAIGITRLKMPSAATLANARRRRSRRRRARAARTAPRRRTAAAPPPTASAAGTTAACRRGSRRTATTRGRGADGAVRARVIGPAPGTGSRASRRAARTSSRRIDASRASRGSEVASSRACSVWMTSPSRVVSNVTPATESSATSEAASRRPSFERTSTWRGRSSIASRMARWPPAAASRPCISTITRSASRSTSLSTCELTITVRPSAPSCLNSVDEVHALHRVGAVQRLVEHEHVRVAHERGGDLGALAHALAERRRPADRRRRASRPCAALVGRAAVGDAVQVGDVADELARGQAARAPPRPRARAPSRRGHRRSRRGSRPSTRTVPWLTSIRPVMARISVVLPAPFGPSRPVTPGPNEQLSSDRATFWPEPHRDVVDLDRRVDHEGGVVAAVGSALHQRSTHR